MQLCIRDVCVRVSTWCVLQWATRAAGHWPKLLQSYDKVADQIAQGVSSALDKADKEITEIQTALTGGGKGEAAAMRDLQEQLADVMEARKETEVREMYQLALSACGHAATHDHACSVPTPNAIAFVCLQPFPLHGDTNGMPVRL